MLLAALIALVFLALFAVLAWATQSWLVLATGAVLAWLAFAVGRCAAAPGRHRTFYAP